MALKAIKEEILNAVYPSWRNFDPEAFRTGKKKKIQSSSKSRVSVSLPYSIVPVWAVYWKWNQMYKVSFYQAANEDSIILEGEKEEICRNDNDDGKWFEEWNCVQRGNCEIIVKSPLRSSRSNNYVSSPSLSDESFKFFQSALFVVQSQQSISAAGSPVPIWTNPK